MQNLQQKLAEHQTFNSQPDYSPSRDYGGNQYIGGGYVRSHADLDLKEDPFKKDKFRQKILEKLGSVGGFDSGPEIEKVDHTDLNENFANGLDEPSDMEYD